MNFPCSKLWLVFAPMLAVGCSSVTKTSPPPPVTTQITVQLNQTSVFLLAAQTEQFSAVVKGTTNNAVTWSVDSVIGGNATTGTITAGGLYTAPAKSGAHKVTATAAADTSESASAGITVGTISLTPATAGTMTNTTLQFTASVTGETSPSLAWSVDGVSGGNSSVGTISSSGLYAAPVQSGNHTIAVSVANDTTANVTAAVSVFSFGVTPDGAVIAPAGTQQFSATIQGITNTAVTWAVDGVAGGNGTTGTISSSGLYTAPNAIGAHAIAATSVAYSADTVKAAVTVQNVAQTAVLTYHNDDTRDGAYLEEVTLAPSNVNSSQFGKLLSYPVDGQIYPQPLYLPRVNIPGKGTHDVVYVATENNSVYAFDADATSADPTTLWHVNFGSPITVYDSGGPWPAVGILSTPVIDASTGTMYVVAEVKGASPPWWLHALDVTTGADKVTPVGVTGSYGSDTVETSCYQRMGLALDPVTNWIYVAFGSCIHGWLLAYDKSSLTQKGVFEDTNGAEGGGLWGSGGAPAIDDATGDLYFMSGSDSGDQDWITGNTMVGYNNSFIRLNASDLTVLDYFAPDNNYTLALNDADLGSGANIILPGSSATPHEVLGGGKDGKIFVVNRDSMGGFNDSSNNVLQVVQTGVEQYNNIFSTPVYWNGTVYVHCNNDVLSAFSWTAAASAGQQLSTSPTSVGSAVYGMHGATASLSANGAANGIIWDIDNSTYNGTDPAASGLAVLHAHDATNLANELYSSTQAGTRDQAGQALKFTVPTIANGRVFVPTATELDIYGLLNP